MDFNVAFCLFQRDVPLSAKVVLQALESNHHDRQVIKGLLDGSVLHQRVDDLAAYLVHSHAARRRLFDELCLVLFDSLPRLLLHVEIAHPIEDAITAHDYEVLMLVCRQCLYLLRGESYIRFWLCFST